MSDSEQRELMLLTSYKLAVGDAMSLCHESERWINKYGGERQRSEGRKLLKRIYTHLWNEAFNTDLYSNPL